MKSKEVLNEMITVFSKYHDANQALIKSWYEIIFLTPRWWGGLVLGIIPWYVWWKFHNKNQTGDLLRGGLLMAVWALVLDSIGLQLGLWIYPYDVFPFIPGYIPWDLTILPVTTMLLIEIRPNWSPIKKAFIYAGLSALVGETLADFFQLYYPLKWHSFFSMPIYFLLYFLCDRFARSKTFTSKR